MIVGSMWLSYIHATWKERFDEFICLFFHLSFLQLKSSPTFPSSGYLQDQKRHSPQTFMASINSHLWLWEHKVSTGQKYFPEAWAGLVTWLAVLRRVKFRAQGYGGTQWPLDSKAEVPMQSCLHRFCVLLLWFVAQGLGALFATWGNPAQVIGPPRTRQDRVATKNASEQSSVLHGTQAFFEATCKRHYY